jgi:hypothetical protein
MRRTMKATSPTASHAKPTHKRRKTVSVNCWSREGAWEIDASGDIGTG